MARRGYRRFDWPAPCGRKPAWKATANSNADRRRPPPARRPTSAASPARFPATTTTRPRPASAGTQLASRSTRPAAARPRASRSPRPSSSTAPRTPAARLRSPTASGSRRTTGRRTSTARAMRCGRRRTIRTTPTGTGRRPGLRSVAPIGEWCNRQHRALWMLNWRFKSSLPSNPDFRPTGELVFASCPGQRWFTEEEVRAAVAASLSYAEALRRLGLRAAGGNHRTIRKYVEAVWRIPVDHFDGARARGAAGRLRALPLGAVLVEGSTYHRGHLKRRLL